MPLLGDRPKVDLRFWLDCRRRRLPPFYRIPGIHDAPLPDHDAELDAYYHPTLTAAQPPRASSLSRAESAVADPPVTSSDGDSTLPTSLSVHPDQSSAAPQPVPFSEQAPDRVYPSAAALQVLQEDFTCVMGILAQPQGVHPALFARISPFLTQMHAFAHDARQEISRLSQQRTYDANQNTMFLD